MATEKTVAERVDALKANKAITPKQLQMLQDMEPEQMKMAVGIVESMLEMDKEPEAEPEMAEEGEPEPENMQAVNVNSDEGRTFIANQVKEGMRRERVLDKLAANSGNAFGDSQLQTMSTDALETYEQSIRPADYSGQGGFASNGATIDDNVQPLAPSRGVLNSKETH